MALSKDSSGNSAVKPTPKSEFGNSLDLVDIQEIRENAVIMKDGSIKQIVMVGGVNFALKSELEQNVITQGYQNFLNSIDFALQIVVHSRKVNVGKYLEGLSSRKDLEESPILKSQIDEYVEFIKGFILKNAIMEKTFLVVVPFYPLGLGFGSSKKSIAGFLPSFMGGKKVEKKNAGGKTQSEEDAARTFKENMVQLGERTAQVTSGLVNIGLEATVLQNDALIELFYNFYNPQTVERENVVAPGAPTETE